MKSLFVLFLALFAHLCNAQSPAQRQIDSLLRAQTMARGDTNEALLLIKIDSLYNTVNPDRGIYFGDKAKEISRDIDWKRGTGLANMTQGLNYKYKAEYKKSLSYLFTARTIFEDNNDLFDLGDCLKYIGVVYQDQKELDTALDYFRKSLSIFESIGNTSMMARVEGNMSNAYEAKGLYDSSLFYGFRALRIFEASGEKSFIATSLGNIGITYKSIKNYDSALRFNQRGLTLFTDAQDKVGSAIILGNIGEIYWTRSKDPDFAPYLMPGGDTLKTTDLSLAIEYFNRAITTSVDVNQIENILYLQPELANAYKLIGDYQKGIETLEQYNVLRDSANKNENITAIATLNANRELKLYAQETEINSLKKQNQLTILIASVIILLIILAIGVNRFIKQLKSNRQLAEEKKIHLETIEEQATVLSDIAYTQSHDVRGEVATILGLAQIFNFEEPADPNNKVVIEGIAQVTEKLDAIVKSTIKIENELSNEISFNPNKNTLG